MRYSDLTSRLVHPRARAFELYTDAKSAFLRGDDVIMLCVGDPDIDTPSGILKAATDAMNSGDTHYTEAGGRLHLRELLAARHTRLTGHVVDPKNIVVGAGAQNVLFSAFHIICGPGDEILLPEPIYLNHAGTVETAGGRAINVAQAKDGSIDVESMAAHVGPKTRAIALTTPANPTGDILGKSVLERVALLARRHNLWVISDEVYASLVFEADTPYTYAAEVAGLRERLISVGSFSKSHAMTGWRMGWAVAPEQACGYMRAFMNHQYHGLPGFVQEGAVAALQDPALELNVRSTLKHRRDLMAQKLQGIEQVSFSVPKAGMFLLLDIRATGLAGNEFAWKLFFDTGVVVLDAGAFGACTNGFVRLSFGAKDADILEGCARIRKFLANLPALKVSEQKHEPLQDELGLT